MPLRRGKNPSNNHPTPYLVKGIIHEAFGYPGLDPATEASNPMEATEIISQQLGGDGLVDSWADAPGIVWVNPPYQQDWYTKIASEADKGINMIALLPARPGTKWFQRLVERTTKVCFWAGRMTFQGSTNPAPFETALLLFTDDADTTNTFVEAFRPFGWIVPGDKDLPCN